jgi:hypothetical protein
MAGIIATDFKNALTELASDRFTMANEKRMPIYGGLQAIMADTTNLITPATIERAKKSDRMDVEISVLKKFTMTNVDADTCSPSGEASESDVVVPTYASYGFAVKANPEIHYGNSVGYAQKLAFDLFQGWKKVYGRLDVAAIAKLEAAKHALSGVTSKYFDTATAGLAELNGGLDATRIYGYMPAFLKKLDMQGGYYEVANTEALTSNLLANAFGAGNNENRAGFQGGLALADNFTTYTSNNLALSSGLDEIRYVFEQGTFGMLNWNRPAVVAGMQINEGETWGTITDPFFGQEWMVHYKKSCTDLSGTYEGLTATIGEHWLIYSNFSFLEAYSSDTTQSCVKFAVPTPA